MIPSSQIDFDQREPLSAANLESLRGVFRVTMKALQAGTAAVYERISSGQWGMLDATANHPAIDGASIHQRVEEKSVYTDTDVDDIDGVRFLAAAALTSEEDDTLLGYLVVTDSVRRTMEDRDTQLMSDLGRITAEIVELHITKSNARRALELLEEERETRHQLIAELEESNSKLEQFAYVASHDMQEPLRMVTGFLGLLKEEYGEQLGEDADEYIEFAVDGAARMKRMIDDLLTYSRMWSSTEPFVEVDMEAIFDRVRKELVSNYPESNVEITHGKLSAISGRRDQIYRLFSNLLGNSIQHSGPDARIEVECEEESDFFQFAVIDHGKGVPKDQQERIFDIFVSGSRNSSRSGSGMGLSICSAIVKEHGGRLWVESTSIPGEGATFYFTISKEERR